MIVDISYSTLTVDYMAKTPVYDQHLKALARTLRALCKPFRVGSERIYPEVICSISGYLGSDYGHLALVQGCTIDNSSIPEILTSIMVTVRNYQDNIRHYKNVLYSKINEKGRSPDVGDGQDSNGLQCYCKTDEDVSGELKELEKLNRQKHDEKLQQYSDNLINAEIRLRDSAMSESYDSGDDVLSDENFDNFESDFENREKRENNPIDSGLPKPQLHVPVRRNNPKYTNSGLELMLRTGLSILRLITSDAHCHLILITDCCSGITNTESHTTTALQVLRTLISRDAISVSFIRPQTGKLGYTRNKLVDPLESFLQPGNFPSAEIVQCIAESSSGYIVEDTLDLCQRSPRFDAVLNKAQENFFTHTLFKHLEIEKANPSRSTSVPKFFSIHDDTRIIEIPKNLDISSTSKHYLSVFSEDLVFKEQLYRMFSNSYFIEGLNKAGNNLLPFDLAKIHIRDGFSVQEITNKKVVLLYQWKPNIFLEWSAMIVENKKRERKYGSDGVDKSDGVDTEVDTDISESGPESGLETEKLDSENRPLKNRTLKLETHSEISTKINFEDLAHTDKKHMDESLKQQAPPNHPDSKRKKKADSICHDNYSIECEVYITAPFLFLQDVVLFKNRKFWSKKFCSTKSLARASVGTLFQDPAIYPNCEGNGFIKLELEMVDRITKALFDIMVLNRKTDDKKIKITENEFKNELENEPENVENHKVRSKSEEFKSTAESVSLKVAPSLMKQTSIPSKTKPSSSVAGTPVFQKILLLQNTPVNNTELNKEMNKEKKVLFNPLLEMDIGRWQRWFRIRRLSICISPDTEFQKGDNLSKVFQRDTHGEFTFRPMNFNKSFTELLILLRQKSSLVLKKDEMWEIKATVDDKEIHTADEHKNSVIESKKGDDETGETPRKKTSKSDIFYYIRLKKEYDRPCFIVLRLAFPLNLDGCICQKETEKWRNLLTSKTSLINTVFKGQLIRAAVHYGERPKSLLEHEIKFRSLPKCKRLTNVLGDANFIMQDNRRVNANYLHQRRIVWALNNQEDSIKINYNDSTEILAGLVQLHKAHKPFFHIWDYGKGCLYRMVLLSVGFCVGQIISF